MTQKLSNSNETESQVGTTLIKSHLLQQWRNDKLNLIQMVCVFYELTFVEWNDKRKRAYNHLFIGVVYLHVYSAVKSIAERQMRLKYQQIKIN